MPIHCPDCNQEVSPQDKFCPGCGAATARPSRRHQSLGDKKTIGADELDDDPILKGVIPDAVEAPPKRRASPPQDDKPSIGNKITVEPPEESGILFSDSVAEQAPTPRPSRAEAVDSPLDPKLDYLIEILSDGRLRPWPLKRPYYSIGRDKAKISLADRAVSRRHLAMTKLGPDWVVMQDSRASKPPMISGWSLLQKTLRRGDVIRIGRTSLVFVPGRQTKISDPLRPLEGQLADSLNHKGPFSQQRDDGVDSGNCRSRDLGGTLDPDEDDEDDLTFLQLSQGQQHLATSQGEPILIGCHSLCTTRLDVAGVVPVHCLLNWVPEGVAVLKLGGEVLVDGRPVKIKQLIQNGQTLTIGSANVSVRIDGDPRAPADSRLQEIHNTPVSLALTAFYGTDQGKTSLLPVNQKLMLGTSSRCDLALPKAKDVADKHLALQITAHSVGLETGNDLSVRVQNLSPDSATLLDGSSISGPSAVQVGQIMQFKAPQQGNTALVLHYDLASDSWPAE